MITREQALEHLLNKEQVYYWKNYELTTNYLSSFNEDPMQVTIQGGREYWKLDKFFTKDDPIVTEYLQIINAKTVLESQIRECDSAIRHLKEGREIYNKR